MSAENNPLIDAIAGSGRIRSRGGGRRGRRGGGFFGGDRDRKHRHSRSTKPNTLFDYVKNQVPDYQDSAKDQFKNHSRDREDQFRDKKHGNNGGPTLRATSSADRRPPRSYDNSQRDRYDYAKNHVPDYQEFQKEHFGNRSRDSNYRDDQFRGKKYFGSGESVPMSTPSPHGRQARNYENPQSDRYAAPRMFTNSNYKGFSYFDRSPRFNYYQNHHNYQRGLRHNYQDYFDPDYTSLMPNSNISPNFQALSNTTTATNSSERSCRTIAQQQHTRRNSEQQPPLENATESQKSTTTLSQASSNKTPMQNSTAQPFEKIDRRTTAPPVTIQYEAIKFWCMPPDALVPGAVILAPWFDNRHYPAVVISLGPADLCTVRYTQFGNVSMVPKGALLVPESMVRTVTDNLVRTA